MPILVGTPLSREMFARQPLPTQPEPTPMHSRLLAFTAVLVVVAGAAAPANAQQAAPQPSARDVAVARRVLRATPLTDGHNDLPWRIREVTIRPRDVDAYDLRRRTPGHTDLDRLRRGMVGAQFWSVYIPGEIRDSGYARVQLEQIDIALRVIDKYPETFELVTTEAEVRR